MSHTRRLLSRAIGALAALVSIGILAGALATTAALAAPAPGCAHLIGGPDCSMGAPR